MIIAVGLACFTKFHDVPLEHDSDDVFGLGDIGADVEVMILSMSCYSKQVIIVGMIITAIMAKVMAIFCSAQKLLLN